MTLLTKIFLSLILVLSIGFGLSHLTDFVTADEHYWVEERIPQYWEAIADGKWRKTFINDKPGVSLALFSGVAVALHPDTEKFCPEQKDRIIACDTTQTSAIYLAFRLPLLIVNTLALILLFFLVRRLTNELVALLTLTFSALSPILLGITQIINPDTLLWSTSAIALFAFFNYLKDNSRPYLILSGIALALAILSKYVAIILLPFFLALILFRFFLTESDRETLRLDLRRELLAWVSLLFGTILLVIFFLPALLVDRKYFLEFIMTVPDKEILVGVALSGALALILDTWVFKNQLLFFFRRFALRARTILPFTGLLFLLLFGGIILLRNFFPGWDFMRPIAFDIKDLTDIRYYGPIPNFFETLLLEWNPVIFSLTPIVLLGLLALVIFQIIDRRKADATPHVYALFFFFLVYTLLLIYSNILSTPRYSILLYPLLAYLSALGWARIISVLRPTLGRTLALIGILLGSLISLALSAPYYFNYTNLLLPRDQMIQDAWGYGGGEAAKYLNSLPDAKNLTVWADYYGVCEFFVGRCLTAYTFDQNEIKPDYYVLTRRGKIRYMSRYPRWERLSGLRAYQYYGTPDPAWELHIGDRPGNFIRVVKVENR